jgi:hypothetical protein
VRKRMREKHFSIAPTGLIFTKLDVDVMRILMESIPFCRDILILAHTLQCGSGIVVGIATGYALDGPGIESRWGEIFHTCPDRPWGPLSLQYNEFRVFPGGKGRPGRDADPSPLSNAAIMKG